MLYITSLIFIIFSNTFATFEITDIGRKLQMEEVKPFL